MNNLNARRAGFTFLEVLMSIVIMSLITGVVVGSMIVHAKSSRSILAQQKLAGNARRLLQHMATDMGDSEGVQGSRDNVRDVDGAGRVFTIANEIAGTLGRRFVQYAYIDRDSTPATIEDNVVIRREGLDQGSTSTVVLNMCSPDGNAPVFSIESRTSATLVNVRLRVGDRTNPSTPADDRFTGVGFQSVLINTSVSREEPFLL